MVSAVPVVSAVSFRWFRFGVSGFSTGLRISVSSVLQIYRRNGYCSIKVTIVGGVKIKVYTLFKVGSSFTL